MNFLKWYNVFEMDLFGHSKVAPTLVFLDFIPILTPFDKLRITRAIDIQMT